jgi:hypothetical protein
MSDSKGHWQLYESSVVLELTFVSEPAANTDTNVNSTTLVSRIRHSYQFEAGIVRMSDSKDTSNYMYLVWFWN